MLYINQSLTDVEFPIHRQIIMTSNIYGNNIKKRTSKIPARFKRKGTSVFYECFLLRLIIVIPAPISKRVAGSGTIVRLSIAK